MGPIVLFSSLFLLFGATERSVCSDFEARTASTPLQLSTESISDPDTKVATYATGSTKGTTFNTPKEEFPSTVPIRLSSSSTEVESEVEASSHDGSPISQKLTIETDSTTPNSVDQKQTQASSHTESNTNEEGKQPLIIDLGALQNIRHRRDTEDMESTEVQSEVEASSHDRSPIPPKSTIETASTTPNSVDQKQTQASSPTESNTNEEEKQPLIIDLEAFENIRFRRDTEDMESTEVQSEVEASSHDGSPIPQKSTIETDSTTPNSVEKQTQTTSPTESNTNKEEKQPLIIDLGAIENIRFRRDTEDVESTEVQSEVEASSHDGSPIPQKSTIETASGIINSVEKQTQTTSPTESNTNEEEKQPLIIDLGAIENIRFKRDTEDMESTDPQNSSEFVQDDQQEAVAWDSEDSENSQFQSGLVYSSDVDGSNMAGEADDSRSLPFNVESPDRLGSTETLSESMDAELRDERDTNSKEILEGAEQRHRRMLHNWYRRPSIRRRYWSSQEYQPKRNFINVPVFPGK